MITPAQIDALNFGGLVTFAACDLHDVLGALVGGSGHAESVTDRSRRSTGASR